MKKKFVQFLRLISLLLPLCMGQVKASGWGGSSFEFHRFTLLNPNLMHKREWWSFFYTSHSYFMDASFKGNTDEMTMANEWKTRFNVKAPADSIYSFLFMGNRANTNPFTTEYIKYPDLKKYIDYAVRCEKQISLADPWGSIYTDLHILNRNKLLREGMHGINVSSDLFWKKKYAFQVLRLAYYQNDGGLIRKIFNTYFGYHPQMDVLDWWALHYMAMVYDGEGERDSANYYHALVFSHSSNKMLVSRQNFSGKNMPGILALTRNHEEMADVYVLNAMNRPGKCMEDIEKIYQLCPQHPMLPLLLIREVNKIENWLGTYTYSYTDMEDWEWEYIEDVVKIGRDDMFYAKRFYRSLKRMRSLEKEIPDLYFVLLADMALLCGEPQAANRYLNRVDNTNTDLSFQKNLLQIICIGMVRDLRKNEVQDEIGGKLDTLLQQRKGLFKSQSMLYSVFRWLQYNYKKMGYNHLAGLFDFMAVHRLCGDCSLVSFEYALVQYFDRHGSPQDVERVLDIWNKPQKNKLEEILLRPYTHDYYFRELMGTLLLRQGKVKEAYNIWNTIPAGAWYNFYNASIWLDEDPFTMNKAEGKKRVKKYSNKLSVCKQLMELQDKPHKTFNDWIKMGNAWFNFTLAGNAWYMLDYSWSNYPSTHSISISAVAYQSGLSCYQKAYSIASGDEERAQAIFYIAHVYFNTYHKKEYLHWHHQFEEYRSTRFYRSVNCRIDEWLNTLHGEEKVFGWDWKYKEEYFSY